MAPSGCTDDQVTVTGIAVNPVADLCDFGMAGTIGEIVYVRNRKREPALCGIVVFAVLPGRKDGIVLDPLRGPCDERKEQGGGKCGDDGCFAHLI